MQVSAELYYDYALDATNRGSRKELMTIWKTSLDLGQTGKIIRALIDKKAVEIAAYNGIVLPKDSTFEDFMALYREQKRKNRCDRGPKTCLIYYAKKLNLKGMEKALSYDINWEENFAIEKAAQNVGKQGSVELVKKFLDLASPKYGPYHWVLSGECLYGAIKKENIEVIQYLLGQDLEEKQLVYGLYARKGILRKGPLKQLNGAGFITLLRRYLNSFTGLVVTQEKVAI